MIVPLIAAALSFGPTGDCNQVAPNAWFCDDLPSAGQICTNVLESSPEGTTCHIAKQPGGQIRFVWALIPQEE